MTEVMNSLAVRTNHPNTKRRYRVAKFKLDPDRKLRREDVSVMLSVPGTIKFRRLIYELIKKPITLRTSPAFLDLEKREHRALVNGINEIFEASFGLKAIIFHSLDGHSDPKSFWVMKLNHELFELPQDYGKLITEEDVKLADVLTPFQRRILNYLKENPYKTTNQLQEVFPDRKNTIKNQVGCSGINQTCIRKGFPPALLRTKTEPRAWLINPEFAELFNVNIAVFKGSLEDLFKPETQQIIKFMTEHRDATASQIGNAINAESFLKIQRKIRIIEQRCEELGLPKPFERIGIGGRTRYKLTDEFRKRFSLEKTKNYLEDYFTKTLFPIVKLIVEEPWISRKDMAERLGIKVSVIHERMKRIDMVCKASGLSKCHVKIIGLNHEKVHRWGKTFLEQFELKEGEVKLVRLFRGIQRRVYEYWQGKEVVYTKKICRDLKITRDQLHTARHAINEKLRAQRLPELSVPWRYRSRIDWIEIKNKLLFYRLKHGEWPELKTLKKREYNIAIGIGSHLGGISKTIKRAKLELSNEEIATIIVADLERQKSKQKNGTRRNDKTNGKQNNGEKNGSQRNGITVTALREKIDNAFPDRFSLNELVSRLDDDPNATIRFIEFGISGQHAPSPNASFYAEHRHPVDGPFSA